LALPLVLVLELSIVLALGLLRVDARWGERSMSSSSSSSSEEAAAVSSSSTSKRV
jgi:hypothetical protein